MFVGVGFGLTSILIFLLVSVLTYFLPFVYQILEPTLIFGLLSALFIGLSNGGVAYIQHVILRLFLWRAGYVPWNYAHFLDYATERILLYRVGGGYFFIYRLLLDYFASLEENMTIGVRAQKP